MISNRVPIMEEAVPNAANSRGLLRWFVNQARKRTSQGEYFAPLIDPIDKQLPLVFIAKLYRYAIETGYRRRIKSIDGVHARHGRSERQRIRELLREAASQ